MPPYNFTDSPPSKEQELSMDASDDLSGMVTDGMTPFDVLSSIFGSTLAPSELEDALATNGFDFDRAMAWLIDKAPSTTSPQVRMQNVGGRVSIVSRDPVNGGMRGRGFPNTNTSPRYGSGAGRGRGTTSGNRVCRYFMAGECLRADCRFRYESVYVLKSVVIFLFGHSHDLERALCRFWLRGTCAKQDTCEFLHRLPKDVDMASLNTAIARANVQPGTGPLAALNPPPDEFPALGYDPSAGRSRGAYNNRGYSDPGRARFASAVKKPVPIVQPPLSPTATNGNTNDTTLTVRREIMGPSADNIHHRSAIVAPRPSPRIKLRPPLLLPTLLTGEAVNSMYMAYRQRALQLGAARNACLSRAADAWRRGDGAAAKRFSREGHDLNAKMSVEMASAAGKLVRERAKLAEQAVRTRDAGWSDDPGDRSSRGTICGGGLGVCLGIASRDTGDEKMSAEERKECMLDLHGLHSNEATEVLEEFLLGVSLLFALST